jgi:hypothetical protein
LVWAEFLRTIPNRLVAQSINRLPASKRKNDDDDEIKMIRSQQIQSSNSGQGD